MKRGIEEIHSKIEDINFESKVSALTNISST